MLTAFDAQSWGTGGAGATSNFPLPYIYEFPNRKRTHTDVYINAGQQRAMRAPGHPQGCFLTEILMDELADRVRMDPVAFRIKNAPPQAPNAMWRSYLDIGAKAFGWDKRHATGDAQAGPVKTGMGCSVHQWGGGGRGSRARRHHVRRRRRGEVRHAGPRHRHADDRRDGRGRNARPAGQRGEAGDRRHELSVQRRIRAAARRRRASCRPSAGPPARRSTRSSPRSPRARRRCRDAGRRERPHPRQGQPREGARGRTRAS